MFEGEQSFQTSQLHSHATWPPVWSKTKFREIIIRCKIVTGDSYIAREGKWSQIKSYCLTFLWWLSPISTRPRRGLIERTLQNYSEISNPKLVKPFPIVITRGFISNHSKRFYVCLFSSGKGREVKRREPFYFKHPQSEYTLPQKKSLFCQPAFSSLTSWEWARNAQFRGNHGKQMPMMAAGKTDCFCLSVPLGRNVICFNTTLSFKGCWSSKCWWKYIRCGGTGLREMKNGLDMIKSCIFHLVPKWA